MDQELDMVSLSGGQEFTSVEEHAGQRPPVPAPKYVIE